MKIIKPLLLLLVVASSLTSCRKDHIKGSGNIVSEERQLANFENVLIKGVIETNITYGTDFSVIVRTDAVAVSEVSTYVSNNALVLDVDDDHSYHNIDFEVDIVMPTIGRLENRGVSDSRVSGFNGLSELQVVQSGVGELRLSGSASRLNMHHDGVGDIHAYGFTSDTCTVHLSGVGDLELTVNNLLQGSLSGVGSVYYHGSPAVSVTDTGVGDVVDAD